VCKELPGRSTACLEWNMRPKEGTQDGQGDPLPKAVWSDLPRRLSTICIGFPLIWSLLQRPILAYLFFMGAHAFSAWEFTLLEPSSPGKIRFVNAWERIAFCTVSIALASIPSSNQQPSIYISVFFLMLALIGGIFIMLRRFHWVTGLVLLTVPFRSWSHLQLRGDGFANTISLLLVVWNADTGALVVGRMSSIVNCQYPSWYRWPVPQWIQAISPKKSMEGFIGGILGGVWTSVQWIPLVVRWASVETSSTFETIWITSSWQQRVGLGIILSLLAIQGDLVESAVKRQSQAKDSGNTLPGHGGILDRFDSTLFAVLFYQVLVDWTSVSH